MGLGALPLLGLALVTIGCAEDTTAPPRYVLAANVEGSVWAGEVSASAFATGDGEQLIVAATRPTGPQGEVESLSIHVHLAGGGTHTLGQYDVTLYRNKGYDAPVSVYQSVSATSGHMTITGFNGIGSVIEGSFDFDAELSSGEPVYGPTVEFRSGHFRAVVKEGVFTL